MLGQSFGAGLRVLHLHRRVRHARRHVIAAGAVGVVVGRNRAENRDLLRVSRCLYHRLADDESGRRGADHAEVAARLRGRIGLRIPRLLLRRRAEQEQQNDTPRLLSRATRFARRQQLRKRQPERAE